MTSTTSSASGEPQPFNYVDEDMLLQLRNVGSRVRKSVTEGFQRTVSVPADPSFATKRLPFTQTPSFISANDAMRDIFAQRAARPAGPSSAPSSPQQRPKRGHNGPDEDSDVEPLDNNDSIDLDLDLSDDEDAAGKREAMARLKAEKAKRDIRPLRRSASRGGATQSLPPSMFRFSHESAQGAARPTPAVAKIVEEEDWSDNFGAGSSVPTVDLEL